MRALVRGGLPSLVGLCLVGCVDRMMPTPLIYRDPGPDPFTLVPPEERTTHVSVLYATDRAPSGSAYPSTAYAGVRGSSLRLGLSTVRIGSTNPDWDAFVQRVRKATRLGLHITDTEEFGALWTTIPEADPGFLAARDSRSVDDPIREPARRFAAEINARLDRTRRKDIVLYVPGFNTSFATPIYRMAGLAQYLSGDAVCIAYSWPAWQTALGYQQQVNIARSSVRNLRELIEFLAEGTDAEHIHLFAYSNGAQMLTDALVQLRLSEPDADQLRRNLRIGYVIYAAADEDLQHFRGACLDGVEDLGLGTVVYSTRADIGLILSRVTMTGSERLGQAARIRPPDAPARPGATVVVDTTRPLRRWNADGLYDHSYWYTNPWVSSDIILMLRHDLPPGRRGLVRSRAPDGWAFPADYPEAATAIARQALLQAEHVQR